MTTIQKFYKGGACHLCGQTRCESLLTQNKTTICFACANEMSRVMRQYSEATRKRKEEASK